MPKKKKSKDQQQEPRKSRRLSSEPPSRPEESSPSVFLFRRALAAFLIHAATSIDKASYVTLRGRHEWSLSLQLLMSCKEFSALLLGCDFVGVRITEEGRKEVYIKRENLNHFMKWYINKGSDKQREGPVEITHQNKIYKDVLRDGKKSIDRNADDSLRMTLVRIGVYDLEGERVNPTLQINNANELPSFDHRLRTGHRRLAIELEPLLKDLYWGDNIEAVMEWVEMKDVLWDNKNNNNDDNNNNNNGGKKMAPTKLTPPPPPSVPSDDPSPTKPSPPTKTDTPPSVDQTPTNPLPPTKTDTTKITPPTAANLKSHSPIPSWGGGNNVYKSVSSFVNGGIISDGSQLVVPDEAKLHFNKFLSVMRQANRTDTTTKTAAPSAAATPNVNMSSPPSISTTVMPTPTPATEVAVAAANPAFTTTTSAANPVSATTTHTNNTSMSEEDQRRFNLLATIAIPALMEVAPADATFDMGEMQRGNLLRELIEYMGKVGQPIKYDTTNSKFEKHLLVVTTPKNDPSSPKLKKGLDTLFGIGVESEIVASLVGYLSKYQGKELQKVLRKNRITPKRMNVYETAVMMDVLDMNYTKLRKLITCLNCFMDVKRLMADENEVRKLGEDHKKPVVDTYQHTDPAQPNSVPELIRYWYMVPSEKWTGAVNSIIARLGPDFDPSLVEELQGCHGGDHARKVIGKFRMVGKAIMKYNGEWYDQEYGVADVQCKSDTAEVLMNTVMPAIIDGMDAIADGKVLFHSEEKGYRAELVEGVDETSSEGTVVSPSGFLNGDIKFLATMLGRGGYEGWWCMWCWLYKHEWVTGSCEHKLPFHNKCTHDDCHHLQGLSIDDILKQYNENLSKGRYDKTSDTSRRGVKMVPILNKGTQVVVPILHLMMGIINQLINYHFDMIDQRIEPLSRAELANRESIPKNEARLVEEKASLAVWEDAVNGGRKLTEFMDKSRELAKKIEVDGEASTEADKKEKADTDECVKALQAEKKRMEGRIKELKSDIKSAKKKREGYTKERKVSKESIYNKCEAILKEYQIQRASYHGGDFNGVNILKMMKEAEAIYTRMEQVMLDDGRAKDDNDKDNTQFIKTLCETLKGQLMNWNQVSANLYTCDPSDALCDRTQVLIDTSIKQLREELKFSITPKLHVMECHVVHQMRTIPGGLAFLHEQWIEHYHQKGHKNDIMWQTLSHEKQADLVANKECRQQHPETKEASVKYTKFVQPKKRKRKREVVDKENRIKAERASGFDRIIALMQQHSTVEDVVMEVDVIMEDAEEESTDLGRGNRISRPRQRLVEEE